MSWVCAGEQSRSSTFCHNCPMIESWNRVPPSNATWAKARSAIDDHRDSRTGYTDVIFVAMAFGGEASGFDRGAAMHLLHRLNQYYVAQANSFEQSPRDSSMWKNV